MRVDNDMHSIALLADPSRGNEVGTQRVILGQICGEVHLLPLELLSELVFARETKLTQVPPFDKVEAAILWVIVHFVGVGLHACFHSVSLHH